MSGFKVYTPDEVSINFGGVPINSLYGSDEFCKIEKAEDDATYEASADGGGTLNVNRNTFTTVTITLKKTSPDNKALSAIYKAGKLTSQGILIVPIAVVDRGSNGDLCVSDKAWIQKFPDEAYAKQAQDISWLIGVHNPERFIGGH